MRPIPATEQAIRNYLDRLSIAARGRLSAEDRQALIERTREFIERSASQIGPANPMQVAAMVSRLDDPDVIIDHEAARLAELRGEPAPASAEQNGRRRRFGRASWHWPRSAGSTDLQILLFDRGSDDDSSLEEERPPPIWVPRQAAPDSPDAEQTSVPEDSDLLAAARPNWPSAVTSTSTESAAVPAAGPDTVPAAGQDTVPAAGPDTVPAAGPGTVLAADLTGFEVQSWSKVVEAVRRWARAHPIEAVAAALLGLGGALYPPVWLVGAGVAVASKAWDYRDKWLGLAGPVVLLAVVIIVGIRLGGERPAFASYWHEGWIYADIFSRLCAILSAYYLVWRIGHARQRPRVPPWNRPRRFS